MNKKISDPKKYVKYDDVANKAFDYERRGITDAKQIQKALMMEHKHGGFEEGASEQIHNNMVDIAQVASKYDDSYILDPKKREVFENVLDKANITNENERENVKKLFNEYHGYEYVPNNSQPNDMREQQSTNGTQRTRTQRQTNRGAQSTRNATRQATTSEETQPIRSATSQTKTHTTSQPTTSEVTQPTRSTTSQPTTTEVAQPTRSTTSRTHTTSRSTTRETTQPTGKSKGKGKRGRRKSTNTENPQPNVDDTPSTDTDK